MYRVGASQLLLPVLSDGLIVIIDELCANCWLRQGPSSHSASCFLFCFSLVWLSVFLSFFLVVSAWPETSRPPPRRFSTSVSGPKTPKRHPPKTKNKMKVFATVLGASLAASAVEAGSFRSTTTDNYWWKYPGSDCGYDDVSPQPACGPKNKGNVAGLEACCLATKGCGG